MRAEFNPDNVELWVCNYRRPLAVNNTVRQWLASYPVERVNVITNHSSITLDTFDEPLRSRVKVWNNQLRPDEAVGSLAQIWNLCYLHSFSLDKPWVLCSQDDMLIEPGWDQLVRETEFEAYFAPQGDRCHLISRDAVRRVGWWDECFSTIGYQEYDYLLRCHLNGVRASIEDQHGGGFLAANRVGLGKFWKDADVHKDQYHENNLPYWRSKWYHPPNDPRNLLAGPCIEHSEVDWYPWFML